jgi:hypothetical protein
LCNSHCLEGQPVLSDAEVRLLSALKLIVHVSSSNVVQLEQQPHRCSGSASLGCSFSQEQVTDMSTLLPEQDGLAWYPSFSHYGHCKGSCPDLGDGARWLLCYVSVLRVCSPSLQVETAVALARMQNNDSSLTHLEYARALPHDRGRLTGMLHVLSHVGWSTPVWMALEWRSSYRACKPTNT